MYDLTLVSRIIRKKREEPQQPRARAPPQRRARPGAPPASGCTSGFMSRVHGPGLRAQSPRCRNRGSELMARGSGCMARGSRSAAVSASPCVACGYRDTSLVRNCPPTWNSHRALDILYGPGWGLFCSVAANEFCAACQLRLGRWGLEEHEYGFGVGGCRKRECWLRVGGLQCCEV